MLLNVKSNYSFTRNSLTFKGSRHLGKGYPSYNSINQKLTFVNIRSLGFRKLSNFVKMIDNKNVVDFLNYEYRSAEYEESKYDWHVKIIIQERHIDLIHQVLNNERKELGIGRIFLIQAITEDIVTSSSYLHEIMEKQIPPIRDAKIDDKNVLYAFPHYSSINKDNSDELNVDLNRSTRIVSSIESGKDLASRNIRQERIYNLVSFMTSSDENNSDEVFTDFNSTANFNNKNISFSRTQFAVEWFSDSIDFEFFSGLYVDGMTKERIQKIATSYSIMSKTIEVINQWIAVGAGFGRHQKTQEITTKIADKFLVETEELDEVTKFLIETSSHELDRFYFEEFRYTMYYTLINSSLGSAKELLNLYLTSETRLEFIDNEYCGKLFDYSKNHSKSMSLDMWININSNYNE